MFKSPGWWSVALCWVVCVLTFTLVPAMAADTERPDTHSLVVTPAVITQADQVVRPSAAVVQPVGRTVITVEVPSPKKGWVWTTKPSATELSTLATIYDHYDNVTISTNETAKLASLLRLMASGAGGRDADLEQLFYYTVFRIPADHPAKAFLEKKLKFTTQKLAENSQEYADFSNRMITVSRRYGLE